jgi:hypothetical protein
LAELVRLRASLESEKMRELEQLRTVMEAEKTAVAEDA